MGPLPEDDGGQRAGDVCRSSSGPSVLPARLGELPCSFPTSSPSLLQILILLYCIFFQSIPDVPPKPGELRTELRGYRLREEAIAAAAQQRESQQETE